MNESDKPNKSSDELDEPSKSNRSDCLLVPNV